jgi:hypothetical protein
MSSLTGMEIFFKKDFLQYTGSFKERGARYALLTLSKVYFRFYLKFFFGIMSLFKSKTPLV